MTSPAPKKRSGFWLFFPFFLLAVVIGLYTAYWFYAKNLLDQGIDDWVALERAAGHTVEFSEKRLGGYPFRFELVVEDPVYEDDEIVPTRWEGQQLQMIMQPWNFQHIIIRSPGMNRIRTGGEDVALLLGPKSVGSASWTSDGVSRVSLSIDEVATSVNGDPVADLDEFEFHLRPAPDDSAMLMLETHWQALELKQGLSEEFATIGQAFGPSILRLEADHVFDLAKEGIGGDELAPEIFRRGGEIRVQQMLINVAGADLGLRGKLQAFDGQSIGTLGVRLENAGALLGMIRMAAGDGMDPQTLALLDDIQAASADGGFLEFDLRPDGLYRDGVLQIPVDLRGGF